MKKCLVLACLILSTVLHAQTPEIASVTNSASFSPIVSPGAVVSIHGSRFGSSLAGASITVGGLTAAVLFVSDGQINAQLPFQLPVGPTTLRVNVQGKVSKAVSLMVSAYAPAVFSTDGSGKGRGVFTHGQGLVTPISGAVSGESVSVYMTGLGATRFHVPAGTVTPSDALSPTAATPTVTVGGVPATVESARLSPGLVGVYQVDFVVPRLDLGDHEVVVSIGGMKAPPVTLPVGPNLGRAALLQDTNGTRRIIATPPTQDASPERPLATPSAGGATALAIQTGQVQPGSHAVVAGSLVATSLPAGTIPGSGGSGIPPMMTLVGSSITYTCDPTVSAVSAAICPFLNGTIAGIYTTTFTNTTANIYITFGNTGLGGSLTELNGITYAQLRTALIANKTSAHDTTAVADSVPATEPAIFASGGVAGSAPVIITNASARALGFSPSGGLTSAGVFCSPPSATCYDSVITISSSAQTAGQLYYRTGPAITGSQYDFYTVVEHETDEVLGTSSCAFSHCVFSGTTYLEPPDLFRYSSNNMRNWDATGATSTNSSCAVSSSTNACFSLGDGIMLQEYNNLNNGEDLGDWAPHSPCSTNTHVQDAEGCPGVAFLDISQPVEIEVLDVVGFNLTNITDVKVTSFHATRNVDGQVLLAWQTGFGAGDVGYRLYREENGQKVLITPSMIAGGALQSPPGVKLLTGRSYAWTDTSLAPSALANYWLEVVLLSGGSNWYGPARVRDSRTPLTMPSNAALLSQIGQGPKIPATTTQRRALPPGGASAPLRQAAQALLAASSTVKISVTQEGWYRVTQPQLTAAGLNPAVDPRTLQLFVDGAEIPISVRGEADGKFDPADSIEFYGIGLDSAASNSRTYWLSGGLAPGKRIRPYASRRGAPGSPQPLLYSVEAQPRTIYFSSLRNGDTENFFGPVVTTAPVDQVLTLHNIAADAPGSAQLAVTLQGASAGLHTVQILVNGSILGSMSFQLQEQGMQQLTVPQSLLVEGDNTVRMVALTDGDVSLVDTIRLTYWRRQSVDSDTLRFDANGGQSLNLDAFSSPNVRVLDVTDPDRVQELTGAISPTANGYAIALTVPNRGARTLFAFVDGSVQQPAAVWANSPSSWRQPGPGADMVIVAHKSLMGTFDSLLQLRKAQGYKVAVVDVEDVFDEFSFGDKSPQAMRDFLSYAKATWQRAPRAVLLVGHASYDPKNYLGEGDSDLVPTKLLDTATMETSSDDWFTAFANDGLAQIQMGRLPARTASDAALMVSKIMEHEAASQPGGVTLVADQTTDFNFGAASDLLKPMVPSGLPVDDIKQDQVDAAAAKTALIAALQAGRQIVNYAGHGSVDLWRNNVLTSADALALTNWANLPLFTIMTCLNGYFQDPLLDSLAESLLKAPNGGASVVWAPSGETDAGRQSVMNQAMFQTTFSDGSTHTIGDAIAKAKASVADTDIRLTWILFGDPLMKKQPQDKLSDSAGKEIVFYHLGGCTGNATGQQTLAAQQREIDTLTQTHTVIVIPCHMSNGVE